MKSIAFILWLLTPGGQEQVAMTQHLDSMAACQALVERKTAEYAARGLTTRAMCHNVIEEVGEVDENGNPVAALDQP